MADVDLLAPKIFAWEGGFVDDPDDRGGATNMGVTLATWQKVGYDINGDGVIDVEDIKLLTLADATIVLKKFYWDRWRADDIDSQEVANILVDWVWASGKWGIVIPQRLLGVTADGIVGPVTIGKVNATDPVAFLQQVYDARVDFIENIIKNDPSQVRFQKGWLNRVKSYMV